MKQAFHELIITVQYSRSELTTPIGSRSLGKGVVEADSDRKQEVSRSRSSRCGGSHGNSQEFRAILQPGERGREGGRGGDAGSLVMSAGHGRHPLLGERREKRVKVSRRGDPSLAVAINHGD